MGWSIFFGIILLSFPLFLLTYEHSVVGICTGTSVTLQVPKKDTVSVTVRLLDSFLVDDVSISQT